MAIGFFSREVNVQIPHPRKTSAWIKKVVTSERRSVSSLNFIFCSDAYLLELNQQYLNHDTYTDVITFPYSDTSDEIEGDIFISVDRVKENATSLGIAFEDELDRVMVHGVLHLMGYSDKNPRQKKQMREKEDAYLSLR